MPNAIRSLRALSQAAADHPDDTFFEVVPRGIGGKPMTFAEFAALLGAGSLDQSFFQSYLSRDYTAFVKKIKGVLYPGYIFKLKSGQNPILLQQKTMALESNPDDFRGLFMSDPGAAQGTFRDTQVSGQPARILPFPASSNTLLYGWFFNTYLVMSTSDAGLKDAIVHF